jgi:hypothetical protein
MIDLGLLRERVEGELFLSYVEQEGPDCIRFDEGDESVWVYDTGEVTGCSLGLISAIKALIKKL